MNKQSGYKNADPAHDGFQYLEDLSTAYWFSQVFFTALELKLFMHLDQGRNSLGDLADACICKEEELLRLLRALDRMELVCSMDDTWSNAQVSTLFLIPGTSDYMGDFFLYRMYMRPFWDLLTQKITKKKLEKEKELDYEQRNFFYVKAMDTLIRQKSAQIVKLMVNKISVMVDSLNFSGLVLDVGGGAGSMIRALQNKIPGLQGQVFDIPEVISAGELLYPDRADWDGITALAGDFRTHNFCRRRQQSLW